MNQVPYPTPGVGPSPEKLAAQRAEINELHEHCTRLVDALAERLPEPDQQRIRTALAVGEWLYLLEDLLAALHQDRIAITSEERDLLAATLDLLGAGDDTAPHVRDRDTVVAALVITPG